MTTTEPHDIKTTVSVTIDGNTVEAKPGEMLIKVAQENGVYIPRFCWHERMKPVGMCRMCLVEVDGIRGLPPACTMPVAEGMVCHTETPAVKQAQDDVLEFLLINHPLDCPVCDRGGECPLQDTTLAFGPGESRFVEEKRHFEKPIPISDVVLLDRERCIQCARCTRFADEIAGDPLISFVGRGGHTQVLNHPDHPFASYFSGNVVQICPVGALTAKPYRFRARPWDLATVETSCTQCAVQCRGALQSSSNRLVRLLAVDSEAVNQGWLCDKGRFGFEYVHSDDRIREPMLDGARVSWPQALDAAADALRSARDLHGVESIGFIGGARGTNEDAYAWARLAKGVIGTDNVDAQLGDGLPAELLLGVERASIADCDSAAAIVLLAPDLKEALPVLHLRVRLAAIEHNVPIIDFSSVSHGLSREVTHVLRAAPGEQGARAEQLVAAINGDTGDESVAAAAATINARSGPIVVILGRANLAERSDATVQAVAALNKLPNVKFLSALRRGNVHGALEVGLAPGILPGRVTIEHRDAVTAKWATAPEAPGLDTEAMLRAAVEGKIKVLVLIGADPIADFPDRALAEAAMNAVPTVIAVDGFSNESTKRAKVLLAATMFGEKSGTITNLEGRVQRVNQKVSPEGTAMDDWRIASEIAFRLGDDFDLEAVDEVTNELVRVAPALRGGSAQLFRLARDGVRIPVAEYHDEVQLRRSSGLSLDGPDAMSWEPIKVAAQGDETGEVIAAELLADESLAADPSDPSDAADSDVAVPLMRWLGVSARADIPGRDAYALRLVGSVALYDHGSAVSASPSLVGLRNAPKLLVAAADLQRLGVTNGTEVHVASAKGSFNVTVHAVKGVPQGTAQLAMGSDRGANALIDAAAIVNDVRVETIR